MKARHDAGQPFFAFIPLHAADGPHVVPEAFYQHYLGKPGGHRCRQLSASRRRKQFSGIS